MADGIKVAHQLILRLGILSGIGHVGSYEWKKGLEEKNPQRWQYEKDLAQHCWL